jgi:hypothetical protein
MPLTKLGFHNSEFISSDGKFVCDAQSADLTLAGKGPKLPTVATVDGEGKALPPPADILVRSSGMM